jgi:hypothetical protein
MALTLAGIWNLDYQRSDSPEAILAAQGIGWATRKVICSLQILETITITEFEVTIAKETKFKNTSDTMKIGFSQEVEDGILGPVTLQLHINRDKSEIIIELLSPNGGKTVITRSLIEEGKVMKGHVSYTGLLMPFFPHPLLFFFFFFVG